METWQIEHITRNLPFLVQNTKCSLGLLNNLESQFVLTSDETETILSKPTQSERSDLLYKTLRTRQDAYEKLKDGLEQDLQSGVHRILDQCVGKQHWKKVGAIEYNESVLLGEGSNQTEVFLGKMNFREVAVKKIKCKSKLLSSVIREVDILGRLSTHSHIVQFFHAEIIKNKCILIALELCTCSLEEYIANKDEMLPKTEILKQATTGLKFLHDNNIMHRDLKPANILISANTNNSALVKLTDFGLAKMMDQQNGSTGTTSSFAGTKCWTAPEVLMRYDGYSSGGNFDKLIQTWRSDIFSLGLIFYFVITDGGRPFGIGLRCDVNILENKYSLVGMNDIPTLMYLLPTVERMISAFPDARPSCDDVIDAVSQNGILVNESGISTNPSNDHFEATVTTEKVDIQVEKTIAKDTAPPTSEMNVEDKTDPPIANIGSGNTESELCPVEIKPKQNEELQMQDSLPQEDTNQREMLTKISLSISDIALLAAVPEKNAKTQVFHCETNANGECNKIVKSKKVRFKDEFSRVAVKRKTIAKSYGLTTWQLLFIHQNKKTLEDCTTSSQEMLEILREQSAITERQAANLKHGNPNPCFLQDLEFCTVWSPISIYDLQYSNPYAYASLENALRLSNQPRPFSILRNAQYGLDKSSTEFISMLLTGLMKLDDDEVGDLNATDVKQYLKTFASNHYETLNNHGLVKKIFDALYSNGSCSVQSFVTKVMEQCLANQTIVWDDKAIFNQLSQIIALAYHGDLIDKIFSTVKHMHLAEIRGKNKESLIHIAIACGNIEALQYLNSLGLSLSTRDNDGNMPVHYLGKWSSNIVEVTKVLLMMEMDMGILNKEKMSVAHVLPRYTTNPKVYHDWVEIMIKEGYGDLFVRRDKWEKTPLHYALAYIDVKKSTLSLLHKADNVDFEITQELLYYATFFGRSRPTLSAIMGFIGNGEVGIKENCQNILHYAVKGGNLEGVEYFVHLGADVNAKDNVSGKKPLWYLQFSPMYHDEIAKILVDSGANNIGKRKRGLFGTFAKY